MKPTNREIFIYNLHLSVTDVTPCHNSNFKVFRPGGRGKMGKRLRILLAEDNATNQNVALRQLDKPVKCETIKQMIEALVVKKNDGRPSSA